ncbi:hypothetical protein DYB38_008421 [Aphanomyces astaci]|uniref:Uncharacterized protein n=1 Tax=Aphanomyces astaci TaxID=112090 RepID=A0A397DL06_APHAT|nr:hypothetical protein DYB38_008421 [Aphanomyces astaci]
MDVVHSFPRGSRHCLQWMVMVPYAGQPFHKRSQAMADVAHAEASVRGLHEPRRDRSLSMFSNCRAAIVELQVDHSSFHLGRGLTEGHQFRLPYAIDSVTKFVRSTFKAVDDQGRVDMMLNRQPSCSSVLEDDATPFDATSYVQTMRCDHSTCVNM